MKNTTSHKHLWKFDGIVRKTGESEVFTVQRCEICEKTRRVSTRYNPNSDKGRKIR